MSLLAHTTSQAHTALNSDHILILITVEKPRQFITSYVSEGVMLYSGKQSLSMQGALSTQEKSRTVDQTFHLRQQFLAEQRDHLHTCTQSSRGAFEGTN
ncbi:hypothetical protein CVS40_6410 [Lucilia cuprina]|nr:hypothetical protein CVS40_6410 [Lucilia cuprina]